MAVGERNGKLTARGQELLKQLREIQKASEGRDGELSPLGAIQHRGIGRRMVKNFPEVFEGDAYVTGRSSTVVRCILSMDNELQEMAAANPALRITSDATESEMYRLAGIDTTGMEPAYRRQMGKMGREAYYDFVKKHPVGDEFIDVIFTDRQFALDSIDTSRLGHFLFDIAANAQSLDRSVFPNYAPYDIFTAKELKNRWVNNNVSWFTEYGNSKITGNLKPFYQKALLCNIIESADTAMTAPGKGANLRFGHEVILMPLTVLMELDDFGKEINNLEEVEANWKNYEIFPMGSNIQMIFYRPEGSTNPDDVLVKVLLNEKERRLPVKPVSGPYYKWSDLRKYYLDKLSKWNTTS